MCIYMNCSLFFSLLKVVKKSYFLSFCFDLLYFFKRIKVTTKGRTKCIVSNCNHHFLWNIKKKRWNSNGKYRKFFCVGKKKAFDIFMEYGIITNFRNHGFCNKCKSILVKSLRLDFEEIDAGKVTFLNQFHCMIQEQYVYNYRV